jgi:hypothetical protein
MYKMTPLFCVQVWRTFLQHETLTPDMAKQFVKEPRYNRYKMDNYNNKPFLKEISYLLHIFHREGEGIPRFRRPRFIPANDDNTEPQLKKQKQDNSVDAGN